MSKLLPVAAVIPTKDRTEVLLRTLNSLLQQDALPESVIIVDASFAEATKHKLHQLDRKGGVRIEYVAAEMAGAAQQRIQGVALALAPYILFMDDDIILENDCISVIYNGFSALPNVGGVNAMITNQLYTRPGFATRTMYRMLHGKRLSTYAGKVIGPAWNLLPEDDPVLPDYVPVEWMNTTCTMYLRSAFPDPVFQPHFKGYSLMEDLALSILVGRKHSLLNARTARIFHDSQTGSHKSDISAVSEMELTNRFFIMKYVLHRSGFGYNFKLFLFELFHVTAGLISTRNVSLFLDNLKGKIRALRKISRERSGWNSL